MDAVEELAKRLALPFNWEKVAAEAKIHFKNAAAEELKFIESLGYSNTEPRTSKSRKEERLRWYKFGYEKARSEYEGERPPTNFAPDRYKRWHEQVIQQAIEQVRLEYEPVQLEVLGDEEIRKYYIGSRLTAVKDAIQATIALNEREQLYRRKE